MREYATKSMNSDMSAYAELQRTLSAPKRNAKNERKMTNNATSRVEWRISQKETAESKTNN